VLNFAINNEMMEGANLPPFLINNLIYWRYDAMTKSSLTKICSKCQVEKSVDAFYKNSNLPDGLTSQCKDCRNSKQKEYYQTHKAERCEWQKQYNSDHNQECISYNIQYYKDNRERLLKYRRKYWRDNKEKFTQYRKDNKEIMAIKNKQFYQSDFGRAWSQKKNHDRRALQAGAKIESFNPIEVFERDGYRCQLCGCKTHPDYKRSHPERPELDHIIPLSLGGEHSKKNTQCLCRHCNAVKYNTGKGDQLRMF